MQAIARAAGVGQATLYRNFPHREALLVAVYRADVEALIDTAHELREHEDPVVALRRWCVRLAAYGPIKRGAALAVQAATSASLGTEYYQPVVAGLDGLLQAGRDTGRIRDDVSADDVLILLSFLWRNDLAAGGAARAEAMIDVIVDGLTR